MFKISPSDFAYLYEECKLCYYLKIKHGIYQPSMPMPGVFSAINTRIQGSLVGKKLKALSETLPDGEVVSQEGWVDSVAIPGTDVYVKGKYDLLVKIKGNSYMVVDLKISAPGDGKIEKYKTQLNAYKFALENPKSEKPIKVTRMGLLIFYPNEVFFEKGAVNLTFPPNWLEVPVDDGGFVSFAKNVSNLLTGEVPQENIACKWCRYRHVGDQMAHVNVAASDEDIPF